MIDALLLDFDGLLVDTETTDYESWRFVYEEHGVELPRDRWLASIGTDGSSFVPLDHLRELVAGEIDAEAVTAARRAHREVLFEALRPLPGVLDWLADARSAGITIGVVSSSPADWVEDHLARVALRGHVDFLKTRSDTARAKPHPDLYLQALEHAGTAAGRAIAVEDSPNGLRAAKAAGLFCVTVPGPMTRGLTFESTDLMLDSLSERTLDSVIEQLVAYRSDS
jgi:HAD superfamily hydrolase (TIGR01509 family)